MAELIVALDTPDLQSALDLVDRLHPHTRWFKIGLELFTAAGPRAVEAVLAKDGKIFLDLKYLDIPNTVRSAVRIASSLGVAMLTVHLSGGRRMIASALDGVREGTPANIPPPVVVGVTMLTSLNRDDITWMAPTDASTERSPEGLAQLLAMLGHSWGVDGVVCSAREVAQIKSINGPTCICVTPGIRMPVESGARIADDDQSRTLTPFEAVTAGADYLVVGRPITKADDPAQAAAAFLHAMAE